MKAFAPSQRFIAAVESGQLRPGYVFLGDEAFFRIQCRQAILRHLVPEGMREFTFFEYDLARIDVREVLEAARTPSLMSPFQAFLIRGVKELYGRGKHDAEFAALQAYFADPNPSALLIFIADHISIPSDARRMELTDKERSERIRETLGQYCEIIEMPRAGEQETGQWIKEKAAAEQVNIEDAAVHELTDSLGGDLMMISGELEKLILYVGEKKRITLGDVETMVLAAKQRSLFDLTEAISLRDRVRALEVLDAIINTGDGEEASIGHLYMLAKTFRQMLVIAEKNVRDSRALWQALWQGFRVPPFAAEDLIRQARRYKSRRELTRALRLIAQADLALRSNAPSKRLILENLILDLASESASPQPLWQQEELPI